MKLCGAKLKSGKGTCKNPAGKNTDHFGEGKCYLHGGASHGPPLKHGRTARVLTSRLKDKIDRYLNDPKRGTLDREQAELRALLDYVHERIVEAEKKRDNLQEEYTDKELQAMPDPVESYMEVLMNLIERICKVVDTMSRMQNRELLTIAEMIMFRIVYADVLREEVTDVDVLARIFSKLRSRLQIPQFNGESDILRIKD